MPWVAFTFGLNVLILRPFRDDMRKQFKRHLRKARYIYYKETLIDYREHLWTFLGSFCGIGLIGLLNSQYFTASDNLFLIGSFGASSVLVYGIINSPLAQPRNLIGGHVICALVGVTIHRFIPHELWLSAALSVSLSIVLMQITKTLHPPGGATALIANIGSAKIQQLGYWYVLNPVLSGVLILLLIAMLFNNLTSHRSYPANKNWYKVWNRRYRS
jgi:CBS domain-containing membrane protein